MDQASHGNDRQHGGAFAGLRSMVLESLGIDPFPKDMVPGVVHTQAWEGQAHMSLMPTKRSNQILKEQRGVRKVHSLRQNTRYLLKDRTYELWGQCSGCLDTFTVEAVGPLQPNRTGMDGMRITNPRIEKRVVNGVTKLVHRPCGRSYRVFDVREFPAGFGSIRKTTSQPQDNKRSSEDAQ